MMNLFSLKAKGKLLLFSTVSIFLFWALIYPNHLINQVMMGNFLYNASFVKSIALQSGGLSKYISYFLTQHYDMVWVGALVNTLLWVLFTLTLYYGSKRISIEGIGKGVVMVAPIFFLGLQLHYDFLPAYGIELILFYGLLLFFWSRSIRVMWGSLLLAPLCSLILSPFLFSLLYMMIVLSFLLNKEYKVLYYTPLVVLLIIGNMLFLHILGSESLESFLLPFGAIYEYRSAIFEIGVLLLPLLFWLNATVTKNYFKSKQLEENQQKYHLKLQILAMYMVLIVGVYFIYNKAYNPRTESYLGLLNASAKEDWKAVLDEADGYDGTRDNALRLINLALAKEGKLPYDLFKYHQRGLKSLLPDPEIEYFSHLCNHHIFYQLGLKNEAYHWCSEAMVSRQDAIPTFLLKRAITLLKQLGKPNAAKKYLYYLSHTSEREIAIHELRELSSSKITSMGRIGKNDKDFLVGSYGPLYDFVELSQQNMQNEMIRDYILCAFLLTNQLNDFYLFFQNYYKPYSGMLIPPIYQQALIIIKESGLDKNVHLKYHIEDSVLQFYQRYILSYKERLSLAEKEHVTQYFGETLWFYYHFVMPKIERNDTKKEEAIVS